MTIVELATLILLHCGGTPDDYTKANPFCIDAFSQCVAEIVEGDETKLQIGYDVCKKLIPKVENNEGN